MTLRTVPGDRWACSACGDCCRLYQLGPVEPAVIAGLEAAGIAAAWAPARDGWHDALPGPDGKPRHFLRQVDGHCVFLRDDQLCAVHALLGEAAKPGFCREYPYHLVDRGAAPGEERAVVVRPSCSGYARSFAAGPPVEGEAERAASLPRVLPVRRPTPTEVEIAAGVVVPWAAWAPVEERLLGGAALGAEGEAGDVDAALDAVAAALVSLGVPAGAPDPTRVALAFGAVVEGVRRLMAHAAGDASAEPHRRAFAVEAEAMLREALPRLRSPRPLAPETDAWMRAQLHAFVLARWYLGIGGVADGFAVYAVGLALVRAAAGEGPVSPADAGPVVVLWTKLTENRAVLDLLKRARPALADGWRAR